MKNSQNLVRVYLIENVSELTEMFEKVIKITSRVLAAIVMFLLVDGFYLSQKGFQLMDGQIVLVKSVQAAEKEKPVIDMKNFQVESPYVLGNDDAPITIYEFSSLGCSHCSDFHLGMLPRLKADFIDSGKVKLIFVDFPIDKRSMQAAMLARCMPSEKAFDFLSLLFKKQLSWGLSFKSEKLLAGYAEVEGLSADKAKACMKDEAVSSEIMYGRQQAMEKLNIQATPSFWVRYPDDDELITGVPDYEKLSASLKKKLED